MNDWIEAGPLRIPLAELTFTASRSGGPGGQHVNKVSSRVTLAFDVARSPSLDDSQRRRLSERLRTRIGKDGVLKMHARKFRSQSANRRHLMRRFAELLEDAMRVRPRRKKTRPTRAARERRLTDKKRRSDLKRSRSRAD